MVHDTIPSIAAARGEGADHKKRGRTAGEVI